ncbi:MAG: hypothetical protein M1347_00830 [Chloroflexi bacterium]|nr:hypothetical protein [Chloroflexota bacterium]
MLTLDLLFAVLRGLPGSALTHLREPWRYFCDRIRFAFHRTRDPLEALKMALERAGSAGIRLLGRAVAEAQTVLELPDLSTRQKQALTALRYSRTATLSQLYKILNQDRSNTYRCLAALVKKGYVGKFYNDEGPSYFAIERKLDNSVKAAAFRLILDYFGEAPVAPLQPIPVGGMTTSTTPTTVTTPTTLTTRQVLTADSQLLGSRLQPVPNDSS